MSSKQPDWTKPAAMAIPKGGFSKEEVNKRTVAESCKSPSCLRLLDCREDHPWS